MAETISFQDTLTVIECAVCGANFAVPHLWYDHYYAQQGRKTMFCPNGHSLIPKDKDEVSRLKAQLTSALDRANLYRDQRDRQERSKKAVRGHFTRIKNRIANGVCPCCNRSFSNLKAHMKTKHPKYVESE